MKGLSVKRIAAVAAGAVMIAATAAAVSVDTTGLSSYPFVTNGAPSVKVVVGAKAAASDGVAAANIAAMIGNLAYKTDAVTVLPGGATCGGAAMGGNVTGVGQCIGNINPGSEIVTLQAKTDVTSPTQTYELRTYLYEALGGVNGQVLESSARDTAEVSSGYYKIDGYATPVLTNTDIKDTAAGKTYKEIEEVKVKTSPRYDTTNKKMKVQNVDLYYNVTFPVTAILYSTGLSPDTVSSGETARSVLSERHRIPIKFLGGNWIITQLNINTTSSSKNVKLAKESVYNSAMRIGDNLTVGNYTVRLGDVQPASGSATLGSATYQVYDNNGNLVETKLVNEQSDSDKGTSGIIVRPYTIFAGTYSRDAYAETAVYSTVLNLQNGQKVDSGVNKDWYVTIYTSDTNGNGNPDSLTGIELHLTASTNLLAGDSISILPSPTALQFTYNGPRSVSTDTLTLTPVGQQSLQIGTASNSVNYNLLKVQSTVDTAFQDTIWATGVQKNVKTNTAYIVIDNSNANLSSVLLKDPDSSVWNFTTVATTYLPYQYKSTESATRISVTNTTTSGLVNLNITEWYDKSSSKQGSWTLQINNTATTSSTPTFVTTSVNFANATANVDTSVAEKYTSLRGTVLSTLGTTGIQLTYPLQVVEASYYLQTSGATATTPGTQSIKLRENETGTLGGLAITAAVIEETIAPCTVTTSSGKPLDCTACTPNLSAVKPSISSATTVTPLDTSANRLVLLDSDAGDVSQAILVGGPIVNTITKNVLPAEVQFKAAGDAFVKVVGTKVIVAGFNAADTTSAANELIKFLASRRA